MNSGIVHAYEYLFFRIYWMGAEVNERKEDYFFRACLCMALITLAYLYSAILGLGWLVMRWDIGVELRMTKYSVLIVGAACYFFANYYFGSKVRLSRILKANKKDKLRRHWPFVVGHIALSFSIFMMMAYVTLGNSR